MARTIRIALLLAAIFAAERAAFAQETRGLPPPPPPPDAVPAAPSVSTIRDTPAIPVISGARPGVVLEQRVFGSDDDWKAVCAAPCDVPVDPHGLYRVNADGMPASEPFLLRSGRRKVDVDAGSTAGRVTGIVLTPVGGTLMLYGLVAYAAGASGGLLADGQCTTASCKDTSLEAVGGVLLVAGAATLATGIALIVSNRTSVSVDGSPPHTALGGGLFLSPRGLEF